MTVDPSNLRDEWSTNEISDPEDSLQGDGLDSKDLQFKRSGAFPFFTPEITGPTLGAHKKTVFGEHSRSSQPAFPDLKMQMTPMSKSHKSRDSASFGTDPMKSTTKSQTSRVKVTKNVKSIFQSPQKVEKEPSHGNNESNIYEQTERDLLNTKDELLQYKIKLETTQRELQRCNVKLQSWHRDFDTEILKYNNQYKEIMGKLQEDLTNEKRKQVKMEQIYESKLRDLGSQIQNLTGDQDQRIRSAQDAAKVLMQEAAQRVLSDDEIENHFKSKSSFWYNWAKENALLKRDCLSSLAPEDEAHLLAQIRHVMPRAYENVPPDLARLKSAPALLVQALLADFMCHRIVSRSLWVLDATDAWLERNADDIRGLHFKEMGIRGRHSQSALELFQRIYPRHTDQWQREIVQLTNTTAAMPISPNIELTSLFCDAANYYADLLADEFVEGPAKFLLKDVAKRRPHWRRSLIEDVKDSLAFSARTWSLKSCLCVYDMNVFETMAFEYPHQMMALHHTQSLSDFYPDDDNEHETCDESLFNGLSIGLVVQPAIIALGNENSNSYSTISRIWCPSTVWVDGTGARKAEKRTQIEQEKRRQEQAIQSQINPHNGDWVQVQYQQWL